MDFFDVLTLLGGIAFFLFGMNLMSLGLEKIASRKLESSLRRLTSNLIKSIILGAGLTVALQSSTAVTVMLVGFANSGLMSFRQAIGIIFGSNIGTTLTSWLLSLVGISEEAGFLLLFKPENIAMITALIGISLSVLSKKQRRKHFGTVLLGFSILMYSMSVMKTAVSGLQEIPQFVNIMTMFTNPVMGVIVGAVFTVVIQSSAASVAILQSLSVSGGITFGMALPIMMGFEIGTCATALVSSVGANKNAKRVAVIHLLFNVLGAVICLIVFYLIDSIFKLGLAQSDVQPFYIAIVQTSSNIITSIFLLPFVKQLEKLVNLIVPDSKHSEKYTLVDERLLLTPSFAVAECNNVTRKMASTAHEIILLSMSLFKKFSESQAEVVSEKESELDKYEDKLGTYLVKLSSKELSDKDSKQVFKMLHSIGDFERLGDHAVNLSNAAKEMYERQIDFSDMAKKELEVLTAAIREILDITMQSFMNDDIELAAKVEPLEQVIDRMITEIKANHIIRLQNGFCTIQMGFVLSDILTNYERISDHCSNIAVTLIEVKENNSFDTHEYLNRLKEEPNSQYIELYKQYKAKYKLPGRNYLEGGKAD